MLLWAPSLQAAATSGYEKLCEVNVRVVVVGVFKSKCEYSYRQPYLSFTMTLSISEPVV
jgi:hypothetical protein